MYDSDVYNLNSVVLSMFMSDDDTATYVGFGMDPFVSEEEETEEGEVEEEEEAGLALEEEEGL